MCNAYDLRHRKEASLDIARASQLGLADLPEFPPRHRIGIKNRDLIRRAAGVDLGAEEPDPAGGQSGAAYPLNNVRSCPA